MPNRPPKQWFKEKVKEIRKGKVKDAEAVAGDIWYHRLTPSQRKARVAKYERKKLDPKPPKPIDIQGYTGDLVRLVPEIDMLIEVVITLPKTVFDDLEKRIKEYQKIGVYNDVEFEKGRLIRRGQRNKATNIFIDCEG